MDTNKLIAYSKIFEFLIGNMPNSVTYENRIIAQKIAYLATNQGIYLGELNFFWHKRGPYSRTLSSALRYYEKNKNDIVEYCNNIRVSDNLMHKLNPLKEIIDKKPDNCSQMIWLEICASLRYLSKENNTVTVENLIETLILKKPFLQPYIKECYYSWELMNQNCTNKRVVHA